MFALLTAFSAGNYSTCFARAANHPGDQQRHWVDAGAKGNAAGRLLSDLHLPHDPWRLDHGDVGPEAVRHGRRMFFFKGPQVSWQAWRRV